jgi:hypothetical protein
MEAGMNSDAARKLKYLEDRVLAGRAFHTLAEEEEDELLEQMDALWPELTKAEQDEANRRAKRIVAALAPETLGLQDRVVAPGSHELPRMVA